MGVLLSDLGVDVGTVLRQASLPQDLFARESASLTPAEYFALWQAVAEVDAEPHLPLRYAQHLSMEAFDPPIFAAACSPNLATAAERLARYKQLIGPMKLVATQTDHHLELQFLWPDDLELPFMMLAGELVFWVSLARLATRSHVTPTAVISQAAPYPAPYRDYLGIAVQPGDVETIRFSKADALLPFVTANHTLWEFFEPQLRKRLSELEVGAATSDRVKAALFELPPAGDSAMGSVARAMAVSTRTLQRRLRGEGTSFKAVLGSTREALARHYLSHSALTTMEISFLLGYEEPNSFYRAFRGWTGTTPDAVRSAAKTS